MRYLAFLMIVAVGCASTAPTLSDIAIAGMAGEMAVRYAIYRRKASPVTPTPVTNCGKCTNGKVRTGDGLDWTQCECGDACECEANNAPDGSPAPKQESPTPVAGKVADPPLVPVAPKQSGGRIECRNGTCYWVEEGTGKRYRVIR